jgi:prolyl-tRNA synthetase
METTPGPARLGQLLFQSLREDPAGVSGEAERLLIRAGFMRQLGGGGRVLLPLGARALRRIEDLVRSELEAFGCQEISLPGLEPDAEPPRGPVPDDTVLSPSLAGAVFASVVRSHRQLPARAFAVRPAPRVSGIALSWVRDRLVADVLMAEPDRESLAGTIGVMESRLESVLSQLDLPVSAAEWATGLARATALVRIGDGEDLLICPGCGYAADRRIAGVRAVQPPHEEPGPLEEVETPDATTIASLADSLGVGPERCAKAGFYALDDGRLLTAIVRGDDEVSEVKLALAAGVSRLMPATVGDIRKAGMVPGYGSPVGAVRTFVVADPLAMASPNLVAGANREGFHLRNVNAGRDYRPDTVADIARAVPGDGCPRCSGGVLEAARGTPLVTWSSQAGAGGLTYADATGARRELAIGAARIELERMLLAVVEAHHDDRGIAWPDAAAPFGVHVVTLAADRDLQVAATTDHLVRELSRRGCPVLLDDRDESPGVKFADADLIGIPLRMTVSPRSVGAGGVEVTHRRSGERSVVPVDGATSLLDGRT